MLKGKLVISAVVVLLILGFVLLGASDSKASIADADAPDNIVSDAEVASNETQEDPTASSSATITITWRTASNE